MNTTPSGPEGLGYGQFGSPQAAHVQGAHQQMPPLSGSPMRFTSSGSGMPHEAQLRDGLMLWDGSSILIRDPATGTQLCAFPITDCQGFQILPQQARLEISLTHGKLAIVFPMHPGPPGGQQPPGLAMKEQQLNQAFQQGMINQQMYQRRMFRLQRAQQARQRAGMSDLVLWRNLLRANAVPNTGNRQHQHMGRRYGRRLHLFLWIRFAILIILIVILARVITSRH